MAQQVTIEGKTYSVSDHRNGGKIIRVTWRAIVPSTASSLRPQYTTRSATIDPSGRLGKKILAAVARAACLASASRVRCATA